MRGYRSAGAIAAASMSLAACATIVRGPNTAWNVDTLPSGAAVKTSNGRACDATPCSITMPRNANFTATLSRPGYKPAEVTVGHQLSSSGTLALAGNLVFGGVPGVVIDAVTGAANDLTPDAQTIRLEPVSDYTVKLGYPGGPYSAESLYPSSGGTVDVRRF